MFEEERKSVRREREERRVVWAKKQRKRPRRKSFFLFFLSFSLLPGREHVDHRREHHQRRGPACEAGAGLWRRVEKWFRERESLEVEVEVSFFFRLRLLQAPPPLSTSNSNSNQLLLTSSRNAVLMACMRSRGTLATLAHCGFGVVFFVGKRERKSLRRQRRKFFVSFFVARRLFRSTSCRVFLLFGIASPRALVLTVLLHEFPFHHARMTLSNVLYRVTRSEKWVEKPKGRN